MSSRFGRRPIRAFCLRTAGEHCRGDFSAFCCFLQSFCWLRSRWHSSSHGCNRFRAGVSFSAFPLATAGKVDFVSAFSVLRTRHQAPGLAVFLVARHPPFARGREFHRADGAEHRNRHHIPNVLRHDVGHEEVNVGSGVGPALDVAAGMEAVSGLAVAVRRLHLHAPGTGAVVEDEVVAVALSRGLGHGEAEGGGFEEERGFGDLSAALGGSMPSAS